MARHEVVLIKCDRCKREELQPATKEAKTAPDFECSYRGTKINYADLCASCVETIKNYLVNIQEWQRDIKSLLGPKVESNSAPPVSAAPDYSPPKPHSAAGTKR